MQEKKAKEISKSSKKKKIQCTATGDTDAMLRYLSQKQIKLYLPGYCAVRD